MGILWGAAFAVLEGLEPCLDENFRSSFFIPDKSFFIQLLMIYTFIGAFWGWCIGFGVAGICRKMFKKNISNELNSKSDIITPVGKLVQYEK